jgi:hypothetical protein
MRNIVAITTTINGKKCFVKSCLNRFDHKISVELSAEPQEAKDFLSEADARKYCDRIFNPYERIYTVEKITIIQQTKMPTGQTQSWLEQRVMK